MSTLNLEVERVAFEEWALREGWTKEQLAIVMPNGAYMMVQIRCAWSGWLHRAEIASEPVAAIPEALDDLSQEIEADAAAFEATLSGKPARKPSTTYPWGWAYTSQATQAQFRLFCCDRVITSAPASLPAIPEAGQSVPAHLLEFVQAIARDFNHIDRETDDTICRGCSGLIEWNAEAKKDVEHHRPDCIVLRAKSVIASMSADAEKGGA